ncbi:MAG TPA: hypothetical protein VJT11_04105 [Nitrospiraceae bacterium]|nr:hypothetical protein [Nitrospiraceae bacterium]
MFPSFNKDEGLVGALTLQSGVTSTACNLADFGSITSHKVKYSHHVDGRTHFSQDGQVQTVIKKQSVALDQQQPHLFTVYAEGLESFSAPRPNDKTTNLEFLTQGRSVKLVASWADLKNLGSTDPAHRGSGATMMKVSKDHFQPAYLIGPPKGSPCEGFGLIIRLETISPLSSDGIAALILVGGFDPRNIAFDHSRETSFLVMKYPCESPNELRGVIASIDFVPGTQH